MKAKEVGKRVPGWLPTAVTFGPWSMAVAHLVRGRDGLIAFGFAAVGAVMLGCGLLWITHNLVAVSVELEKNGTSVSLETPRSIWILMLAVVAGVLYFHVFV